MVNESQISNSVIVVNQSDRFSKYLTGSSIDNTHIKTLSDFNNIFNEYPLTVEKIVVFESSIIDLNTVQEFSKIILSDYSQVGEIVFLVEDSFRSYFEVSLETFPNKRYLSKEITNSKLEEILTERQAFKLKNKPELGNVYQVSRKALEETPDVPQYKTYITVGRSTPNPKIVKESDLLNREVDINSVDLNPEKTLDVEYNYFNKEKLKKFVNNEIVTYDSGLNIYDIIMSDYSEGRKIMIIDNTDSMLFSFLVENNESLPKSILLEDLYKQGVYTDEFREFFETSELCIIRNSYALTSSISKNQIEDLINFVCGNYGPSFNTVYILTDDLKYKRENSLQYLMIPATMDNLMKMVNHRDTSKEGDDLRNVYVKLINDRLEPTLKITEQVIRIYTKDLGIENIIVVNNSYNKEFPEDTHLFDIIDIELGRFKQGGTVKNENNVNRKKRISSKS